MRLQIRIHEGESTFAPYHSFSPSSFVYMQPDTDFESSNEMRIKLRGDLMCERAGGGALRYHGMSNEKIRRGAQPASVVNFTV